MNLIALQSYPLNKFEQTTPNKLTPNEYKSIIRNYFEQLYANKMEDLEEMNKILGICNISSMNQKEI